MRDTTTYEYKIQRKVSHRGITNNPKRREAEHRRNKPGGRLVKVGGKKTRQGALRWERSQTRTRGYC